MYTDDALWYDGAMTTTVTLDMGGEPTPGAETVEDEMRAWMRELDFTATFRVLREHGPAGGAPEVEWTFEDEATARRVVLAYSGGDVEQADYLMGLTD